MFLEQSDQLDKRIGIITYQSYPEMGISCMIVIKGGHNIEWENMGDDEVMILAWRSVRVHGKCRD